MLGVELVVWVLALIIAAMLIFCMIFLIISLVDLESDFVNPVDMCRRCNQLVLPEYAAHLLLTVLLLLTGNWLEFLLNLPILLFHILRLQKGKHKMDPTNIFNILSHEKAVGVGKLCLYMISLFYFLYKLVLLFAKEVLNKKYGYNYS